MQASLQAIVEIEPSNRSLLKRRRVAFLRRRTNLSASVAVLDGPLNTTLYA